MKKYNIQNYVRYKNDLEQATKINDAKFEDQDLVVKYLPLVEKIARRFSTEGKFVGILDITDLIQEGSIGLINALRKVDDDILSDSVDPDATLHSFLSKRIKGTIRRSINTHRNNMRIPESEMNRLKKKSKETNSDEEIINQFLQAIFLQLDNVNEYGESYANNVAYEEQEYLHNDELIKMINLFLNDKEQIVVKRSFGIDCDKAKAKEIAVEIGLKGENSQVRVSEIKRAAIFKLCNNLNKNQFIKFM